MPWQTLSSMLSDPMQASCIRPLSAVTACSRAGEGHAAAKPYLLRENLQPQIYSCCFDGCGHLLIHHLWHGHRWEDITQQGKESAQAGSWGWSLTSNSIPAQPLVDLYRQGSHVKPEWLLVTTFQEHWVRDCRHRLPHLMLSSKVSFGNVASLTALKTSCISLLVLEGGPAASGCASLRCSCSRRPATPRQVFRARRPQS